MGQDCKGIFFCFVAVAFLVHLDGSAFAQSGNSTCDGACQTAQLSELRLLFAALGASQTVSATPQPQMPEHCSWVGVVCCNANLTAEFSAAAPSSCLASNGTAGIQLPAQGLQGSLPAQAWTALASTLQFIDLSGPSHLGLCVDASGNRTLTGLWIPEALTCD